MIARLVGMVSALVIAAACSGGGLATQSPVATPTARIGATFLSDPAHGTLLLFGGRTSADVLGDTWVLTSGQWRRVTARPAPPARSFAAATPDGRGGILLFGGDPADPDGPHTDTWRWDGSRWSQLHPKTVPDAGVYRLLAGSPPVLVVFGADHQVRTWTWRSGDWQAAAPGPAPPWRSSATMAGNLLFGGVNEQGAPATDTWTWDGAAWTELHPAHQPAGGPASMAPLSDGLLLFEQDGTWTWTGTDWTLAQPAGEPPWQPSTVLAASPGAAPGRVLAILLTGTVGQEAQAWRWNGFGWTQA